MRQAEEMKNLNMKLEKLQNLFRVGEKIIPGIQKLVDFMVEIVPMLNNINSSIQESTKKIPRASTHLSDVTNATEIATTEILDKVDQISQEVEQSEKTHSQFAERYEKMHTLIGQIEELVGDNPAVLTLLKEIERLNGNQEQIDSVKKSFALIKEYLQTITITLQVQDITAQQLASVNHLIVSVQKKLSSLIFDLSGDEVKLVDPGEDVVVPQDGHFDDNASYLRDKGTQLMVDDLVNTTTQEDIDKLFSANGNK